MSKKNEWFLPGTARTRIVTSDLLLLADRTGLLLLLIEPLPFFLRINGLPLGKKGYQREKPEAESFLSRNLLKTTSERL